VDLTTGLSAAAGWKPRTSGSSSGSRSSDPTLIGQMVDGLHWLDSTVFA
jgi:hypothetical protein